MASSRLQNLLLILKHILLRIKSWGKHTTRALFLILRRVLVWWRFLRSKVKSGSQATEKKGIQSSSPDNNSREVKSITTLSGERYVECPELSQASRGTLPDENPPFTIAENGETISLKGAAFSLSPYTSARKGAGSAQSLHAQRLSHSHSVISHNASLSSQDLGSELSLASASASTHSGGYEFQLQRSPTHPYGPRRQFSSSDPTVGPSAHRPFELYTEPIQIPSAPSVERLSSIEGTPSINISRSQSPVPRYLNNPRITPTMPECTRRYDRRGTVLMADYGVVIPPLQLDFTTPEAPAGWTRFIHPEGALYFFHNEKRIYTESDLFDNGIFSQLTDDVAEIERFIDINAVPMPDMCLMFIDTEYSHEDKGYRSTYLFVDHRTRSVFFLDAFKASTMAAFDEVWGCKTFMHLGHEIEAQYWYFVQLYPDCLALDTKMVSELRDVLLHSIGDSMSSAFAMPPLNLDDLHKILGLTNSLEKNVGLKSVGSTSLFGRFMYIFAHARFQNFHGETCARLERDVSVHDGISKKPRTWLVKILSPILFSAPDVHLTLLRKMYVDGVLKLPDWEASAKKMNDEWQEFILFATVLLNANVAFLAIQSVDMHVRTSYRGPSQVASYVSVIASIGSIILGLLLIRQNRTKQKGTAMDVAKFLSRREHKERGLETLAILHSLPYALLMWGMVSFLIAFALVCLDDSDNSTRIITVSAFFAMAILVAWCVWSAWESQPADTLTPTPEEQGVDDEKTHLEGLDNASKTTSTDNEHEVSGVQRTLWNWMPDFIRKGSMDSDKTVTAV
ncbi:hypothetical protein CPB83DRAFT_851058 [Crepidotus variabilis]|uniref:Uncharacterized protein n=1 Tax=Crepidotus variabilis TaxID=179855 RepID=A0A9P6JS37_9AGAR|nr:hypothetical protein CPB83DRAFT_851058 [Crepidotus variabilis]